MEIPNPDSRCRAARLWAWCVGGLHRGFIGVLWGCCRSAASVSKGLDSAKGCDCEGLVVLLGDDGRLRSGVEGDREL